MVMSVEPDARKKTLLLSQSRENSFEIYVFLAMECVILADKADFTLKNTTDFHTSMLS